MAVESDIQEPTLGPTPAVVRPLYSARLGEELPIFCERCGYSLNGLPQTRCADCKILQFHCPECAHHQPINTLRPAAQRIFGRVRALWLCFAVFFKLNFFGWLLVAWTAMGVEWSYQYDFRSNRSTTIITSTGTRIIRNAPPNFQPAEIRLESLAAFACFGLAFGLFGRLMLLRWRRGYLVGITLAILVLVAVCLGAQMRKMDTRATVSPFTLHFTMLALEGAGMVVMGAWIAWPIWTILVRLFLPRKTAAVLLEWQRSLSDPRHKLGIE